MKLPADIPCFGDVDYRGKCPPESAEQITFFSELRRLHPETYGRVALHPRNEGKRHYTQTARQKAEGMADGASDVIIPGSPTLVIEIKRKDHTKSKWQDGQQEFLRASRDIGAHVCIALGWEAAMQAFEQWLITPPAHNTEV